jgi:hypothetical protein
LGSSFHHSTPTISKTDFSDEALPEAMAMTVKCAKYSVGIKTRPPKRTDGMTPPEIFRDTEHLLKRRLFVVSEIVTNCSIENPPPCSPKIKAIKQAGQRGIPQSGLFV